MKKILITGGAGFIGFHLASRLLRDTETNVVLIDNLQRGRMDDELKALLAAYADRAAFIAADLTDPNAYKMLDRDFDHVYHLAAVNGTKHFYAIPDEVLRINVLSLVYLLEWIKSSEKKSKLMFTSSNEAYAGALESFDQLRIPTPEHAPLVISDTYNPRWTYAGTKLIGEQFVIHYAQQHRFPAVIVRPHNFYGPRAGFDHVIPEFSHRIHAKVDPFPIYGADETRTFCYITDAVKAMQMLMDSPATDASPIETVHIGATDEVTMRELADALFAAAGWRPETIEVKPSPPGSVKRRLANIEKIQRLIGWVPETRLADGLRETFAWYATHPKPEAPNV
jgi:nucleoside-diphosphate-sugar epimerase